MSVDLRPRVKPEAVAKAIIAASEALLGKLKEHPRFPDEPSFAATRRFFCVQSDDVRRAALAQLLIDEGRRIAHERASRMSGATS